MNTFIDIALLNCCTYSCDYCIAKASRATAINCNEKGTYIPNGHMLRARELLAFLDKFDSDTVIQLTGGEPLLYPAFELLVGRLYHKFSKIIVNTNGNQLWRIDQTTKDMLWWRVSWHRDYRDINAFLKDIDELPKDRTLINYIAHPKRIADRIIKDDMLDLEMGASLKNGWKYEVSCFEGEWNDLVYNKTWHEYANFSTFYSKPIKSEPKTYISIKPNGDIMKCYRIKIGNIYEEKLPSIFETCDGCSKDGWTLCPLEYSAKRLGII